jgi:hypothetical protein
VIKNLPLKIATLGFACTTFGLVPLIFAARFSWSMADFDCVGTYWECHRGVAQRLSVLLGVPLFGWATYLWLLIRAWKKA